jgi:DNA-binding transcriptional MocR family regulator
MVEATLRQAAPRLAYVIADHHNPTGHVATAAERAALVDAARRTGTLVVVDETLAELTLDPLAVAGPGVAPVAAYDAGGSVVTIGSASKTWWGGLRVGWVRATPEVVRDLSAVRATGDLATAVLEQLVVAQLLGQGEEPLRARRRLLAEQRDAALAALADSLPAWRVARPAGGLSLWAELPDPASSALAVAAARHGVHLAPGPRFGVDGTLERFVRVPFALPAPVLREAIRRLATAYDDVAGAVTPPMETTLAV